MPVRNVHERQVPYRARWHRLSRNPAALVSAGVLFLLVVIATATLPFSARWYNLQELTAAVRVPPSVTPVVAYSRYAGALEDPLRPGRGGTWSAVVRKLAPLAHMASSWLGHDELGRSLLYRLLPGFLITMSIGLVAAALAVVIGTGWGTVAALLGGRVDLVMMRVVDVLYGLPYILMVILLKIGLRRPLTALLGGNTKYSDVIILLVAIGAVSWLTMARVIRGQVLSLRERPFVEAARAAGAGPWHILRRHLLPNLAGPIAVYATLVVPQAILQAAFLSFLGIGVQQPVPSLGRLAADGVEAVNTFVAFWWLLVFPCGLLVITLLALNFLGDALRDAFDPKPSIAALT
ncbi:MAG: ABC transporter permease [Phycisphaerae bacterium]